MPGSSRVDSDLASWELVTRDISPESTVLTLLQHSSTKLLEDGRDIVGETDAVVHFQGQLKLDPKKKRHSTRDRVLMFADNEDPALVVLLFQFGRYLLIASSRPGTFVSNLQGVWNNQLYPAWRYDH
jgi:hypothetical protein